MPTQKSYSSSETLKAFDHEQRLHYGGCVADLVHHEADEYSRQGVFAGHGKYSDLKFNSITASQSGKEIHFEHSYVYNRTYLL